MGDAGVGLAGQRDEQEAVYTAGGVAGAVSISPKREMAQPLPPRPETLCQRCGGGT